MQRNDWRLQRPSTLNTAFKQAVNPGVSNMQEALDMFKKLKRDEAAILSQQALYIQVLSDIVVDNEFSYTLTMRDARRHIC